jgi:hypothetical protein
MDYKYIEQLLERYWECQTSAAEESILHAFFTQEEVPAHLAQYKSLFEYEEVAGQVEYLGEEFDQKVLELVGEERAKISAEEIVIHARRTTTIYRLRPFFRAAASVAIIVLVGTAAQGLFQEKESNQTWDYNQTAYKDSFKENEVDKALEVFRKEMSTISKSLRDTNLVVVDSTKTK